MRAGPDSGFGGNDDKDDNKGESSHDSGGSKGTGGSSNDSGPEKGGFGSGSMDSAFGGSGGGFGTSDKIGSGGFGSGSDLGGGWGSSDKGSSKDYGGFDSHGGFIGSDIKSGSQGFNESFGIQKGWAEKQWEGFSTSVADAWQGVKDWTFGKEMTGTAPMGTPDQYGLTNIEFDETIGKEVYESKNLAERLAREVDYFTEAPMDYASDLMDNPMVAGAAAMSGLGLTAFGLKAVDAAIDMYQGETDPLGAAQQVAAGALSFTPVGSMVPSPVRGIAIAGLKSGAEAAAKKTAGVLGGTVGAGVGNTFANAVTDNPYARAAITAASTVGGTWGGVKTVQDAIDNPNRSTTKMSLANTQKSAERSSPLISSGEKAVTSSKQLMAQPVQTDLYANMIKQLPYYGVGGTSSVPNAYQQQPYYGV